MTVNTTAVNVQHAGRAYKVWLTPTLPVPRAVRIDVSYPAHTAYGSPRQVTRSIAPGGRVGQAVADIARKALEQAT